MAQYFMEAWDYKGGGVILGGFILSQSKDKSSLIKFTMAIVCLSISLVILSQLSNHSSLFNLLLLANIIAIAIVGYLMIVGIIKNTLKS